MQRPLLNNEREFPKDNVLLRCLGKSKVIWDMFVNQISSTFAPMSMEWRFYHDGKAWLCKLVHTKKTVCWISIWPGYFKTTFYFTDKNAGEIKSLNIAQQWKSAYLSNKSIGKLKPLTVEVKTKKALADVLKLVRYKSNWR